MKTITLTPDQESIIRQALYGEKVHIIKTLKQHNPKEMKEGVDMINDIYDILNWK